MTSQASALAGQLAMLQGAEAGTLATSTLHLFWDLCSWLARWPAEFFVDDGAYPIARWGVERAAARGAKAHRFPHHDPSAMRWRLRRRSRGTERPVVITDGVCPVCGRMAPLRDYLAAVREAGGLLVVDDTQGLGILGWSPTSSAPYGRNGAGSLAWSGVSGSDVIVVSSLAKGFGVPLAVLCASASIVPSFRAGSETSLHCSPPSMAAIHAARHALRVNAQRGEMLRAKLIDRVQRFQRPLTADGLRMGCSLFPVQTLHLGPSQASVKLHRRLARRGIQCLLQRDHGDQPVLRFLITARHIPEEVNATVTAILEETTAARQRLPQVELGDLWRRFEHERMP